MRRSTIARVLVALTDDEACELFPDGFDRLRQHCDLEWSPDQVLPPDLGRRFDACLTGWGTVLRDQRHLDGGRLHTLIHIGASVRRLVDKATCARVQVSQPGAAAMAAAVAEMSLAMSLVLLRDIHRSDRGLHDGIDWQRAGHGILRVGLADASVGILGLGRTGQAFARMCRSLNVHALMAYDPYATPEQARSSDVTLTTPEELFSTCDLVVNHLPSTQETYRFVKADLLALMRTGTGFVNTARAWSVDMSALAREVRSTRLAAALDVFDVEPLPLDSPWRGLNAVLTPHVAGGTTGARRRQGELALDELERALTGLPLRHLVTPGLFDVIA